MNVSVLNRVKVKNSTDTFVVVGFWVIGQTPKVQLLNEQTMDIAQASIDQIDSIIDEDIRNVAWNTNTDSTVIPLAFLDAINVHYKDDPITSSELRSNPRLLQEFTVELNKCKHKIINGSVDAASTEWGMELAEFR